MGTTDRVAVVTGAASGMGLAIPRHLTAQGIRVGMLDLQREAVLQAAEGLRNEGADAVGVAMALVRKVRVGFWALVGITLLARKGLERQGGPNL